MKAQVEAHSYLLPFEKIWAVRVRAESRIARPLELMQEPCQFSATSQKKQRRRAAGHRRPTEDSMPALSRQRFLELSLVV